MYRDVIAGFHYYPTRPVRVNVIVRNHDVVVVSIEPDSRTGIVVDIVCGYREVGREEELDPSGLPAWVIAGVIVVRDLVFIDGNVMAVSPATSDPEFSVVVDIVRSDRGIILD